MNVYVRKTLGKSPHHTFSDWILTLWGRYKYSTHFADWGNWGSGYILAKITQWLIDRASDGQGGHPRPHSETSAPGTPDALCFTAHFLSKPFLVLLKMCTKYLRSHPHLQFLFWNHPIWRPQTQTMHFLNLGDAIHARLHTSFSFSWNFSWNFSCLVWEEMSSWGGR